MCPDAEHFFERLYKENFGKLKRYACVHLDPVSAEELVQDTFHDALEKMNGLVGHENPYGWLMVTLKYKIRNYQRIRQKDLLRLVSLDSGGISAIPASKSAADLVEETEDGKSAMERIQGTLSAQELYMVKRLIYEKATHKDLAEELGITIWTSQKRLERIRDKLGKLFPGYRPEK